MRKAILFIAMSLDGYIADREGKVDWLNSFDEVKEAEIRKEAGGAGETTLSEEGEDTYTEFIKGIDTIVMGWKTYYQIVTELSPLEWPYKGLASYVITHRKEAWGRCKMEAALEKISFVDKPPGELVRRLKKEPGKDIWICGGANIIRQLMQEELIDRFHLSIIPIVLGSGIGLFAPMDRELRLRLVDSRNHNGITEVVYEKE